MTLHVTVLLDRTAVILAGRTDFGRQTVPITDADLAQLSADERRLLAERADNDGTVSLTDLRHTNNSGTHTLEGYPVLTEASVDAVRMVLTANVAAVDAYRRKEAEDRAAQEVRWDEAQREWLARSDDELVVQASDMWRVKTPDGHLLVGDGANYEPAYRTNFARMKPTNAVLQRLRALAQIAETREEDNRRRKAADKERGEAMLAARKEEETKTLRRAVEERGTDAQRKRLARGLMPREEMLTLYRDQAFQPLDSFTRYERLTKANVLAALDDYEDRYDDSDYEFKVFEADDATDEEFATLDAIEQVVRARLPDGATCQLREHCGGLERSDDWTVKRKSVLVTIPAPVQVSREYACP